MLWFAVLTLAWALGAVIAIGTLNDLASRRATA
jgi:hypothetical protein